MASMAVEASIHNLEQERARKRLRKEEAFNKAERKMEDSETAAKAKKRLDSLVKASNIKKQAGTFLIFVNSSIPTFLGHSKIRTKEEKNWY